MKLGFYSRFALDGIRKNKRLYLPYLFTGSLMVTIFYIMIFLSNNSAVGKIKGGNMIEVVLPLGAGVIAIFALLFMFYTNSFLIKQRYKEFGLLNILGLNKRNLYRVMFFENLYVAAGSILSGLLCGILLSKGAELILLNLLQQEIDFSLRMDFSSLWRTTLLFAGIYFLLFLNSLLRVKKAKPLELMQSSRVGERMPKRNWVYAFFGLLLLFGAYTLAVRIENPLVAMELFFVAVIMVIGATYLLFIAGSVVFCKLLQKNKRYYYQSKHFVSVSSMMYRMKRNGAGLASICILLTMVLVMITSTASLFFGMEESVSKLCSTGMKVTVVFHDHKGIEDENLDKLRKEIRTVKVAAKEPKAKEESLRGIRGCQVGGLLTKDGLYLAFDSDMEIAKDPKNKTGYLLLISLEEYNVATGFDKSLGEKECLLYSTNANFSYDSFFLEGGESYKVKEVLSDFPVTGKENASGTVPVVYLVVNDVLSYVEPHVGKVDDFNDPYLLYFWEYGYDCEDVKKEMDEKKEIDYGFSSAREKNEHKVYFDYYDIMSRQEYKDDYVDLYGSLFFLGIMLSIVFLTAAILIIYYKQICEGYEDQSRFDIMQKIGMTKKDIKASINSQVLTVFFLPLLMAGLHLSFAFPFVSKILKVFNFDNLWLNLCVNLICFACFSVLYSLVYKLTSGAYYAIVSEQRME